VKVYGLLVTGSEASGVYLIDDDGSFIGRRYDLGGQGHFSLCWPTRW